MIVFRVANGYAVRPLYTPEAIVARHGGTVDSCMLCPAARGVGSATRTPHGGFVVLPIYGMSSAVG